MIDWQVVIIACIVAVPSTISSFAALIQAIKAKEQARLAKDQSAETHHAVNSRMDKFLAMVEANQLIAIDGAKAQATLDEKSAERERTGR